MSNLKDRVQSQEWGKNPMISKAEAERVVTRLSLIFLRKGIKMKEKAKGK